MITPEAANVAGILLTGIGRLLEGIAAVLTAIRRRRCQKR